MTVKIVISVKRPGYLNHDHGTYVTMLYPAESFAVSCALNLSAIVDSMTLGCLAGCCSTVILTKEAVWQLMELLFPC